MAEVYNPVNPVKASRAERPAQTAHYRLGSRHLRGAKGLVCLCGETANTEDLIVCCFITQLQQGLEFWTNVPQVKSADRWFRVSSGRAKRS